LAFLFPLLVLPLFIHLLNKRFPKTLIFSSIERIRKTRAERSRLFQWRHVLMIILRTLAILLLLIAFLQPILARYGSDADGDEDRRALILVDHSLSMEHNSQLVTARTRALTEARKIVSSLEARTPLNVILVERQARTCFFDFSPDITGALAFLDEVGEGVQRADFNRAIDQAANMIQRDKGARADGPVDLYFVSDFQRQNWTDVRFDALPEDSRLFFIDVGATGEDRENRAVLDATIDQATVLSGARLELTVQVGNFTGRALQNEPLDLIINRSESIRTEVSTPAWSQTNVRIPLTAPAPGVHEIELRLDADNLPADDTRRLTIEVLDKEEVVIVTDRPGGDPSNPARFVQAALNPYADLSGSLLPRPLSSDYLTDAALSSTTKVILLGIDALGEPQAGALARFLQRGGGAIWFLDGEQDGANLKALAAAEGGSDSTPIPLQLAGWQGTDHLPDGAQRIARGEFKSRFLRLFQGTRRQNLAPLRFYRFQQAVSSDSDSVILEFADGTPAMIRLERGLGTLLLANFSLKENDSNLVRQRLFPAWMQELVKNVNISDAGENAYQVGDQVQVELWQDELRNRQFVSPSGSEVTTNRDLNGNRYFVSFRADEPGFYRLGENDGAGAANKNLSFAVNADRNESDLRPIDPELLPRRADAADDPETEAERQAHFIEGADDYRELRSGQPVAHWFLLALLFLLLLEALLHPLIRRSNA
jgi:hypothetical protein